MCQVCLREYPGAPDADVLVDLVRIEARAPRRLRSPAVTVPPTHVARGPAPLVTTQTTE